MMIFTLIMIVGNLFFIFMVLFVIHGVLVEIRDCTKHMENVMLTIKTTIQVMNREGR